MKKIVFSGLVVMILASCGEKKKDENDKSDNKKNDTTITVQETDTNKVELSIGDSLIYNPDFKNPYGNLKGKELKTFKFYLGDSLTAEILALHQLFDLIKTDDNMLSYFNYLNDLKSKLSYKLSDKIHDDKYRKKILAQVSKEKLNTEYFDEYSTALDEMREQLATLSKYFHGMKPSCVAECSEPYFDLVIADLIPKAEETDGDDDNEYFALLKEYYHEEFEPTSMNAKWFEATWDYGGSSKLGEGIHLNFLLATDKLMMDKNIFYDWILKYREDCVVDLARWKTFLHGKEELLKELNQILSKVKLNESQKKDINERLKEVKEFKANDPTGHGLQLNCKNGNCQYG